MNDPATVDFFLFSEHAPVFPGVVRSVLETLQRAQDFSPAVWGFESPVNRDFVGSSLDIVMSEFAQKTVWDPLVLRDKKDRFSYLVDRDHARAGLWHISGGFEVTFLRETIKDEERFVSFVDALAGSLPIDYGHIVHSHSRGAQLPFDLNVRLPDIPNLYYFGPRCIDFFGRDRLWQAPFVDRTSLTDRCVKLRISSSVLDPVEPAAQESIRNALGVEVFMKHPTRRYLSGRSPFAQS